MHAKKGEAIHYQIYIIKTTALYSIKTELCKSRYY